MFAIPLTRILFSGRDPLYLILPLVRLKMGYSLLLAPMIISVLLLIAFNWESYIDDIDAAMYVLSLTFSLTTMLMFCPRSLPSLWRHPNVPVLAAVALLLYFWSITFFILDFERRHSFVSSLPFLWL